MSTVNPTARSTDATWQIRPMPQPALLGRNPLVPIARLERVIQEQQARFPLLNYERDLVAVCDFNGFLTYLNPIGRQLMGVGAQEDLSLFQVRCFTPLTQDLWDEIFTQLLEDGLWSGEQVLSYKAAPVPVKLLVTAHRPNVGEPIDCFTIVARVQVAAKLQEEAYLQATLAEGEQLRRMVGNVDDVLFEIDRYGQFIYLSDSFERLLGFQVDVWMGKSPLDLTHPDDQKHIARHIRASLVTGEIQTAELRVSCANDSYLWMSMSNFPIFNEAGEIVGFHGILRDISRQRTVLEALEAKNFYLEQALKNLQQARTHMVQSEKMSSLRQVVAGIAHEINNPINFIYGNLKYAQRYIDALVSLINQYRTTYTDPPAAIQTTIAEIDLDYLLDDLPNMLGSMQVGANRIRAIVLTLRNFSRLDESQLKTTNLHEGIDSTLLILQNRLKAQTNRPEIAIVREFSELPHIPVMLDRSTKCLCIC